MAAKTMSSTKSTRIQPPQAFVSSYAPRIRTFGNALLAPVVQPATVIPPLRMTKRGTTAVNYADDFDDDDFDDSDSRRRPTGLRSLRQDHAATSLDGLQKHGDMGKELDAPVTVQGIWRDWMGKNRRVLWVQYAQHTNGTQADPIPRTEKQQHIQAALPLTLVPIRIDLDIPSFRPEPPLPVPQNNARDFGIDETLPAYTRPEPTPAYRLKDSFLWNLHEALMTPDQFAKTLVDELDLPPERKFAFILDIAKQIREQLEQYAGIALHPLFQPSSGAGALNGNGAPSAGPSHGETAGRQGGIERPRRRQSAGARTFI
ncbi:hypothetical protein FH972_026513 [Carpinus fangiana]|uniref:Uncharacterized protein n=1 Tax=Carpinus fangiana TaxID=176857 RepID=A0A5N6L6R1_9ROSI|nr:hypothetical protein FH972_026513 [Carpinus fangiana]